MSTNVTVDLRDPSVRPLRRRDLKAGTVFVYNPAKQLFMVPETAFSRQPNIGEKDIVIGGDHGGSLDDWHPDLDVVVVDLHATRSASQPVATADAETSVAESA